MYATSETYSKPHPNSFKLHHRNSMPSPPLPMHIPSKTGTPLRHLLLYGQNSHNSHSESGPNGSIILTISITMLVTVFVTVVCMFILWRWYHNSHRASRQLETRQVNQISGSPQNSEKNTKPNVSSSAPETLSLEL